MGLPSVQIKITDGALGGFNPTGDGVAGLVCEAVAVAGAENLALNTAYQLTSLKGLTDLGVTATNNALLYRQVSEFYEAADGAELWVWGAAASVSLADMADKTKHHAPKLLEAAQGKIRLLGISSAAKNAETIAQGLSNV